MRDVTKSLTGRQQFAPQQSSVNQQVYATPVNTLIDPGKNQTMLQIANGLSSLVPELQQATDTLIQKNIKQDMLAGQTAQMSGETAPTDGKPWVLHGYQQASAIARGIEYTSQIEGEASTQFNPQDPQVWEKHGDPIKAVDSFYRTKAQEAIKGMRPEYAHLFLQNVEKSRLQALEKKQQEVQKFHYENKMDNLGVIAEASIKENIASGKLNPEDSRGLFSFLQDKAVGELGIDRKDASGVVANAFMKLATDEKAPNPDLLNFLDIPDANGIKLSMTSVGAHLERAKEAATRAKVQQVDFNHVAALGSIEDKVNRGEDVTADLMDYVKQFPEQAKGRDSWIANKITESGINKERILKQQVTEKMMSPDYYAAFNLDQDKLKGLIESGDLEGADRHAQEMAVRYTKDFDNKDLGKTKADIIKRAENMRNYQAISLVDLPDGKEKDEATSQHLVGMEKEGLRRGLSPEQIDNQKLAWLSTQGYVDTKTKAQINNGLMVTNLDPNSPPPPEFLKSIRLADDLHRMKPELYQKTISDDSRRIIQMYTSALDEGGASPESAYAKVMQRLAVPLHEQPLPTLRVKDEEVEEAILAKSGFLGFRTTAVPGYEEVENQGHVFSKIKSYVDEAYEWTGNKEKAIKQGIERYNSQTMTVRGRSIWIGDATKYPDMEDVINHRIEKNYGLPKDSDENKAITVVPTGAANIFVLYKNGRPIVGSNFNINEARKDYHLSQNISEETAAARWTKQMEAPAWKQLQDANMKAWQSGK